MIVQEGVVVLHAGHGQVPFPVYLYRVLLYLVAFGGIALLAYWLVEAIDSVRTPVGAGRDDEEIER